MSGLLLDTAALIRIAEGAPISEAARFALAEAAARGAPVHLSAISAWEIGLLVARGKLASTVEPKALFAAFLSAPGVVFAAASADTLIRSSFLPGEPPTDPSDRITVATARDRGLTVLTRNPNILAYAEQGHVAATAW